RYVLIQDCRAPNVDSINQYFWFITGSDLTMLGCFVKNSRHGHPVRASQNTRLLIAFSDLTDMDRQAVDSTDFCRTCGDFQQGVDLYLYQNKFTCDITTNALPTISKQVGNLQIG